jgi:hypothetical protein
MSEWPFQIRGVRTAGCVENARAGGQRCWAAARIARIRLWFHFFGSPLRLIQWPRENSSELGQTWYRTRNSCTKFECDVYLFRGARGNWGGRIRRSGHGMPCPTGLRLGLRLGKPGEPLPIIFVRESVGAHVQGCLPEAGLWYDRKWKKRKSRRDACLPAGRLALRKAAAQSELLPRSGSNLPREKMAGTELAFYLGDGYRDDRDQT